MKVTVPDMSCSHCVLTIQKSLLVNGLNAQVSLLEKTVTFNNERDMEKIIEAIKKVGYTPEV